MEMYDQGKFTFIADVDAAKIDATIDLLDMPLPVLQQFGVTSFRAFFAKLAQKAWDGGESFDGKRPFGSSDWQNVIVDALVTAGYAKSEDDGYTIVSRLAERLACQ